MTVGIIFYGICNYLAEQLGMSSNGYGALERGDNDFTLDKLEKLSELFEMSLNELVDVTEKNVFNLSNFEKQNQGHQGNAQFQINNVYSSEYLETKHELEKQVLLNEMQHKSIAEKDEQIASLKKIIQLLEQK